MDCNKYKNLIEKKYDSNITETENFVLDLHVKNCDECKEIFNLYEQLNISETNAKAIYDLDNQHISIMNEIKSISSFKITPIDYNKSFNITFILISVFGGLFFIFLAAISTFNYDYININSYVETFILSMYTYISIIVNFIYHNIFKLKIFLTIIIIIIIFRKFFKKTNLFNNI